MKEYRLIIQPAALEDLVQAYQWILERSPEAAARWFNGFVKSLDALTKSPERCGLAPENAAVVAEIRQFLYRRPGSVDRALFTITGQEVRILHIRHAARKTLSAEDIESDR